MINEKYTTMYLIFCVDTPPPDDEYEPIKNWAYSHLDAETVIPLTSEEVQNYQTMGLWEVVSEATDNWLFGYGEGEWFVDIHDIRAIKESFEKSKFKELDIVKNILFILSYAITYNKTVAFHF